METQAQESPKHRRKRAANGVGVIDQRASGTWRGRLRYIDPDTKLSKRLVVSGKTQGEVVDKLRKAKNRLADGLPIEDSAHHLAEFLEQHFDLLEGELKPTTVRAYRAVTKSTLIPALGNIRLRDLTPKLIETELLTLPKKGPQKARSRGLALHCLSGAMERAVKWKLLRQNPCSGLRPPRTKPNIEQKHWDAEQARTFLAHARNHANYAFFRLALSTGARKGELLALQWRDFDPQGKKLRIERNMDQVTGEIDTPKSGKGRVIDLSDDDAALIESLRDKSKSNHILATPGTGIVPREIATTFARLVRNYNDLAKEANLRPLPAITFHGLRHTCATLLLANGTPVKAVTERLGHANVGITMQLYQAVLPSTQAQAANTIADLLSGDQKIENGVQNGSKSQNGGKSPKSRTMKKA